MRRVQRHTKRQHQHPPVCITDTHARTHTHTVSTHTPLQDARVHLENCFARAKYHVSSNNPRTPVSGLRTCFRARTHTTHTHTPQDARVWLQSSAFVCGRAHTHGDTRKHPGRVQSGGPVGAVVLVVIGTPTTGRAGDVDAGRQNG
jgi:hypothetical protein